MSARPVLMSAVLTGPEEIRAVVVGGRPALYVGPEVVLSAALDAPDAAGAWRALAAAATEAAGLCDAEQAERAGESAGSAAALLASQLVGADGIERVRVDAPDVVTVTVRPRDRAAWRWCLARFQVPAHTITHRGSDVTTAKGEAPGGVTVCIVAHGVAGLQAGGR